ncbi:acyl-CoA synthetase [Alkalihalophilus pseudofirmus]|nr:acyl-CoA synthetase [Alkalihalophilus pseudofirmus]
MKQEEEVVVRKLEKWAETIGHKTFFYYGEDKKRYTFKEFNEVTNSIAHSLYSLGVRKGDRISLFLQNPLVTTLMMFGIWKVGAIYAPINFNYMGKLLSHQINDTDPKILITEIQLVSKVNEISKDIYNEKLKVVIYDPNIEDHDYQPELINIKLDQRFEDITFSSLLEGKRSNLKIKLNHWNTANIIYTSGTTGPAKGVVQSHRWMYAATFYVGKMLNHEDVIYSDLPLYHIAGAFVNIARAAYVGCSVAVWDKFSANQFWERIKESGATSAILVDVMIHWLMKADQTPKDRCNTLNKVHVQPLIQSHNEVAKRFGFDFITVGFGQTETGFGCFSLIKELDENTGTPQELYKGRPREEIVGIIRKYNIPVQTGNGVFKRGYMGKSSIFIEATILNENDEECKVGEIGQIALRPRLPNVVLSEYFRNQEATLQTTKNYWFHTGDAGYRDENGYFHFVDRIGTVLRVKGENISSYQVEDIINSHPKIDLCAVFPIPADEGDEDDVVAFVVLQKSEELIEEDLQIWLEKVMPKYMLPKYIRFIDEIPRTPTNKAEKYKLKQVILRELSK